MAEHQLPKLVTRVRFPSLAPYEDNKKDIVRESPDFIGTFCGNILFVAAFTENNSKLDIKTVFLYTDITHYKQISRIDLIFFSCQDNSNNCSYKNKRCQSNKQIFKGMKSCSENSGFGIVIIPV